MEPLRAVILDNDETTGSYIIVISIIKAIKKCGNIDILYFYYILERLSFWMLKKSLFRPGIVDFLRTLRELRKANKIDAIVMYTNQYEVNTSIFTSLPRCIEYMFTFLVPGFKFDNILSRPSNPKIINNVFVKQFSRVLDLYPDRPMDITQILFFDDLALHPYVDTENINVFSESARVLVEPYSRILNKDEVDECIKYCFNNTVDQAFISNVFENYSYQFRRVNVSINILSCSYFTDLIKAKYDLDGENSD